MDQIERCRAGIDNSGTCEVPSHRGWHTAAQATTEHMGYGYDRCRREAGHEHNPDLPYHKAHLPDCGGVFYDSGLVDHTERWEHIWDLVKSSGECLDWYFDEPREVERGSR